MVDILFRLEQAIDARKDGAYKDSYVAQLCEGGVDRIAKKIGEEATETVIAAKGGARSEIVHETADLWFHSLVMLRYMGIDTTEVLEELERRFGKSGLAEKKARRRES